MGWALKKGRRQALRRNAPALRLEQPACAPADPPSPLGLIPGEGPGRGPARARHAEPKELFASAKRVLFLSFLGLRPKRQGGLWERFASAKRWVVGALRAVKAWIGVKVRVNGFEAAGGRALR